MADLDAARNTPRMLTPFTLEYSAAVKNTKTVFQGGGVAIGSDGDLVKASEAGALYTVGVAAKTVIGDGTKKAKVLTGVHRMANDPGNLLTKADRFGPCYWADDQTVGSDSSGLLAGIVFDVDSHGVWVAMGLTMPADVAAGAILENDSPTFNDLAVTDDLTVGDDMAVTGLATIGETLGVTGVSTLAGGSKLDTDAAAPVRKCDVVTVTAAQLRALAAVQKTLVAAQAGKAYRFVGALLSYRGGSNAFDSVGAGEDLAIRYENGAGAIVSATLDTTTDINFGATTDADAVMPALATVVVAPTNKALVLDNVGGGELAAANADANGDGIVTVTIEYDEYTVVA